MGKRLAGIALGLCLLAGCASPRPYDLAAGPESLKQQFIHRMAEAVYLCAEGPYDYSTYVWRYAFVRFSFLDHKRQAIRIRVLKASGPHVVIGAILNAVRSCSLPAPPPGVAKRHFTLLITVTFPYITVTFP